MYLSVSWVLTISYQLFTETAVSTISNTMNTYWPTLGTWISGNQDTIVFVYAFTWIFVLSSVIPGILLGKERSILIQYGVVLTLTLITFAFQEFIFQIGGFDIKRIFDSAVFLNSPILAVLYLGIPYFVMIGIEIRSRKKNKKMKLKKMPSQKGNNQKGEKRDNVVSRDDLGINSEDRIFFSDSF